MPTEATAADDVLKLVVSGKSQSTPIVVAEDDSGADITVHDDEESVEVRAPRTPPEGGEAPRARPAVPRAVEVRHAEEDDDEEDDDPDDVDTPIVVPPKFDAHDLTMARDLGLTVEEVRECETPAELRAAIRTAARRRKEAPVAAKKGETADEFDFNAMFGVSKEEEELLDPDAMAIHKKIGKGLATKLKELDDLKKSIAGEREERKKEADARAFRQIDRTFARLGHDELFGPTDLAKRTDAHRARRMAVLNSIDWATPGLSIPVAVAAAVKLLYGAAPAAAAKPAAVAAEDPADKKKRKWSRAALAAPTTRRDKKPDTPANRLKQAERNVAAILRDRGQLPDSVTVHDDDAEGPV